MGTLNVHVWHTKNVQNYMDLLAQSCEGLPDVEIVGYVHDEEVEDKSLQMGQTHKSSYHDLMIKRWKILLDIIESNIGNNIVWLDCDCVFNKSNKEFATTINNYLEDNDFVHQYDPNSHMNANINLGVTGIKCSEKTLQFVKDWYGYISTKTDRKLGFPQIEWNDMVLNYADIKFAVMPDELVATEYSIKSDKWLVYHAIGITHPKEKFLKLQTRNTF
jgi:hypothetical protein